MKFRRLLATVWVLPVLFCLGCGGGKGDTPDMGTVTGTVTLDDAPAANVTVIFTSDKGRISSGLTDENGKYELGYSAEAKGAEIGSHKVSIETALDAPPAPDYKDPIPAIYNKKSTLTATVVAGENPPIDFALKSK